jgi:hypothetical protein
MDRIHLTHSTFHRYLGTQPPRSRKQHILTPINSNDSTRWLLLADTAAGIFPPRTGEAYHVQLFLYCLLRVIWDRVAAYFKSHPQLRNGGRNPFDSFRQLRLPPETKARG